jgi:tetratricopeptide (TPR) repeat protein
MNKIEQLLNLLKNDEKDTFLLYALSLEYIKLKDYSKSIEILQFLVETKPNYLATYYQYGKVLNELGEITKAEIIYKKGIEIASSQNNTKIKQDLESALFLLD